MEEIPKFKKRVNKTILASISDHQHRIRRLTEDLILEGINRDNVLKLARESEIPEILIRKALDG